MSLTGQVLSRGGSGTTSTAFGKRMFRGYLRNLRCLPELPAESTLSPGSSGGPGLATPGPPFRLIRPVRHLRQFGEVGRVDHFEVDFSAVIEEDLFEELSFVFGGHQRYGFALPAGPRRAAHPVGEGVHVLGDLVIIDVAHVVDVQSPGRRSEEHTSELQSR